MAKPNGRPEGVPDGFGWGEFEHNGEKFIVRELNVAENDEVFDGSKNPDGTINERLNLRLAVSKSVVSPPVTLDDMATWPSTKLILASRAFNRVNSVQDNVPELILRLEALGYKVNPPETLPNS